jgi:DNA primase
MTTKSLNKDKILSHTNCNDIYITFLGIAEFPTKNISSPFSTDKKPSFKVYPNGTFKCYCTGKQGDVWQFVAYLLNLDNKKDFKEVLKTIAIVMNIQLQDDYNSISHIQPSMKATSSLPLDPNIWNCKTTNCNTSHEQIRKKTPPKKLNVEKRGFTLLDLQYWQNFGVEESLLKKYNCNSISSYYWTGTNPIFTKKEALAFVWELEDNHKLYIPNQPNMKIEKKILPPFSKGIFGLEQLGIQKKENIIICEGEKDVLVASSRGFDAVTFGSSSINVKKEQIELLQNNCNNIFVCFDSDIAGINGMNNFLKFHQHIIAINLPVNNNIKGYDITDYFQEYSKQDFEILMDLSLKKN